MSKKNFTVKQTVAQGMVWNGSVKVVVQIVSWASTLIVARILNPDDYGLMAIQGVFSGLVILVLDFGVTNGLINAQKVTTELSDGFFYLMMLAGVIFFIGFTLAAPLLASFYESEELTDILRVSGLLFVIGGLRAVPFALAMRDLAYKFQAIVEGVAAVVGAVTVLGLALSGFGVWSLVLATVANQGVSTFFYLIYYKRIPKLTFPWAEIVRVLRTGGKIVASRLAALITQRADVFLLGIYAGPVVTGYYSMAFSLAAMPLDKVGLIFNQMAFPAFSRLQDDPVSGRDLFVKLHKYLVLICVPVLCGGLFVVEDLTELVLGEKWLPAVFPLQVILGLNILRLSERFISTTLMGIGAINAQLYYRFGAMIVMPLAFFIGVQQGINGLLLSWMLIFPAVYAVVLLLLFKYLSVSVRELGSSVKSTFCCTLFMSLALILIDRVLPEMSLMGAIGVDVLVGGAVFFGALYGIFNNDFRALINIKSIFKR